MSINIPFSASLVGGNAEISRELEKGLFMMTYYKTNTHYFNVKHDSRLSFDFNITVLAGLEKLTLFIISMMHVCWNTLQMIFALN